jgi:hypothetical protein
MDSNDVNRYPAAGRASFTDLLRQLAGNLTALIHNEIELIAQGVREKARHIRIGILLIAVGSVFGCAAMLSLCAAAIIGLSQYMAPVSAALVTAAASALIGVCIALTGYKLMQRPAFEQNSIEVIEKEAGND